jgi:RNA polymerase sigma-70 factor, ECF subfamily
MVAISYNALEIGTSKPRHAAVSFCENTSGHDLEEFNKLVLAYQDVVYRQALWILGEEEAAQDAAQEAFLRAYRNFHTYNGGPFQPWILKITTNYCLDQLRRLKNRRTVSLEIHNEFDEEIEDPTWLRDPAPSVEETVDRQEEHRRIMQCINRLSPEYRAVIFMVDLEGMDYSEASMILGIPMGTFKSRLSRARMMVQRYFISGSYAAYPVAQ